MSPRFGRNLAVAPLFAALLALPLPALACGGFFCFTQPIDQSAERILYVQQEGKITVHIQISYTGEDDKFSWVLPLLAIPDLGIGSDSIFQVLEQNTSPTFQLNWKNTDDCYGYSMCQFDATTGGVPGSKNGEGGGVEVLKEEKVGPYDTVVIKGGNAAELIKWLTDNGYQQPKETAPLIDVYVNGGYVFLALKLQKDKGAGDIAPIVLTLEETSPCLPIRLTAVATQPDMPIVAWMLGAHRAIPKNYLHVVVNEATIDWLQPGTNYKTVISKAVDQASGHAFATEYAQPTSKFTAKFAQKSWDTKKLELITDAGKFMQALLGDGYPRTTQMQGLLREFIPKPKEYDSVSDSEFYNCIQCEGCSEKPCADYKAAVALQPFDAVAFALAIQENIVAPLTLVQGHFETLKYLTRMYTTLSADEMDKDPIFAWNPDLPDVDRAHTAQADPICAPGSKQAHEVKITFKDGSSLVVPVPKDSGNCMFDSFASVGVGQGKGPLVEAGGQPAAKVEVLDESGPPLSIDPRVADQVDAALNNVTLGKPSLTEAFKKSLPAVTWDPGKVGIIDPTYDPGTVAVVEDTSGCSAGHSPVAPWWTLLTLIGTLALIWRRRVAVR